MKYHTSHDNGIPAIPLRRIALLNIAIQVALPLSVAFTPSTVVRADDAPARQHTLNTDVTGTDAIANAHQLHLLRTRPYTLKKGETPLQVAGRYHLTLEQLRLMNQFRTFARGFSALQAGDELDVPNDTQPAQKNEYDKDTRQQAAALKKQEEQAQREARIGQTLSAAQTLGQMLDTGKPGEQAVNMAKGMAQGYVNAAVQGWLNQFGTTQLQLSVDNKGKLTDSALDMLVPLYDSPDHHLVFTQVGVRNKDSRNTLNMGLGSRYLTDNWLLGVNTFYDWDMTGHNRRLGVGAEAWTDYLQLSANGYYRLSGWHDSRDVKDYDERPANGWDVRAVGYLPALPQLGGKLMYEQYYGDEVALFGKENRQKDPHALTVGGTYTPVPLVTLGADERLGEGGKRDTNISLQVNYQFGQDWLSQITPGSVAASRQIAETRYNLVDRNNDIVLEYRKQELISLELSEPFLRGPALSQHTLVASVNSKYPLRAVNWQADRFTLAGGIVTALDATHIALTLPAYQTLPAQHQSGSAAVSTQALLDANTYELLFTAQDVNGNPSPSRAVRVEVSAPVLTMLPLTVTDDNQPADGIAKEHVIATLTDSDGHPQAGQSVTFSLSFANGSTQTQQVQTDSQGKAILDVTSTVVGVVNVTATAGEVHQTTTMTFVNRVGDVAHSTLVATPATIKADGLEPSTVTLTLHDAQDKPLVGQSVGFASDLTGSQLGTVTDNGDGTYTATLTGTTAGIANLTAIVNGSAFGVPSVQVTLTAVVQTVVVITGNPVVGETLTATCNGGACSGTQTFQWQIEDAVGSAHFVDIAGATHDTYAVQRGDQRKKIQVQVTE
ncbi:TPA: inverse autotransporter beta domain-containing protein [Citrobacter werkmanii]|nr:inverse autotransporter beta domain-containing protein [Citrobacter werkmanii]